MDRSAHASLREDLDFSIEDCLDNDPAAWTKLVELVRPVCLRMLVKVLGKSHPDVIPDLEQEVYLRLLGRRPALESLRGATAGELRVYAATVALNLSRDHLRRSGTQRNAVQALGEAPALVEDPEDMASRRERILRAFEHAAELTGGRDSRDMQVFVAYFQDGFSASEISELDLGLGTSGVESVIHRMTRLLRGILGGGRQP